LVKEALSSVLMEAGFSVFHGPGQRDNDTIVVIDCEDCKSTEWLQMIQSCGVKIVALTSEADSRELEPEDIEPLSGLLTYELSVAVFVDSLRLIRAGARVVPQAPERKSQAPPADVEILSHGVRLSPRQEEILSHLVAGGSNELIARKLAISEAMVKVHLKDVLRKIGVENRTQATIWALANLPEVDTHPRAFV
jgi:two-component system nitrate/nitrite response regulator NarL